MPKALSQDERSRIADEIRKGEKSANQIAKQFGRAVSTISRIASDEGLAFDRSKTKAITEAKAADNARRLESLKGRLLEEADVALDELHSEAVVTNWHQGQFHVAIIGEPTFTDKRNIMWRAGGAITNYLNIETHQGGGEDLSEVDSWLDAIAGTG